MSQFKVNLLKFTEDKWVVVPGGNTVQQILDVISRIGPKDFKDINMEYVIDDINGQPDILFELYEMF